MKQTFTKALFCLVAILAIAAWAAPEAGAISWKTHDRDRNGTRHQPDEDLIGPGNVGQLIELASYQASGSIIKGPTVTEDAVYFTDLFAEAFNDINGDGDVAGMGPQGPASFDDYGSYVYKLDKNLNEIWKRKIEDVFAECNPGAPMPMLMVQTAATLFGDQVIVGTSGTNFPFYPSFVPAGYLISLNTNDGSCRWTSLITDPDHLYEGVQSSPTVDGHHIYIGTTSYEEEASGFFPGYTCCNSVGKVVKVDLRDGSVVWSTELIAPHLVADGYSGVTVYASPGAVIDPKNKLVIVATGDAYRRGNSIDPASVSPMDLPIDAMLALDMDSGEKVWVQQAVPQDFWTFACIPGIGNPHNCPHPAGPNYNISAGPLLLRNVANAAGLDTDGNGRPEPHLDLAVGKVKDGRAFAVELKTGQLVWDTQVGPPVLIGLSGLAFDGKSLFVNAENTPHLDFSQGGLTSRAWTMRAGPAAGAVTHGGCLSALDPSSGAYEWQATDPYSYLDPALVFGFPEASLVPLNPYLGPPSSANGVVYQTALAPAAPMYRFIMGFWPELPPVPNFHAFDARSGELLWSAPLGAMSLSGATIVNGRVYVGTGFLQDPGRLVMFGLPE
ncbi:hypothetical protein FBR05_00465 [Deltaproteobacteria bacterium PRO3]|nr:hypothetical protein [Deltaproteobacteria bacterium PRO3]